ncbi:MAG: 50S ribosomal protein L23 [Candidatus Omnitrophica bacterium]|nr:50S ribosomal protein L23 [Candidatus Omnitrophota bacterium]
MRPASEVIRGVRQTEKGARIAKLHQYILEVAPDANKIEIRQAAKQLFGVTVERVNTTVCHGKWRRLSSRWGQRPDWKKAIVTVAKGQKIEVKAEAA